MKNLRRPLAALCAALLLGGCSLLPFRHEAPRPGRTKLSSPLVVLPAQTIGTYLVLEAKWDRSGPYRFIIDTGSSVTLVTPAFAKRYPNPTGPIPDSPRVRVKSSDGRVAELPATSVREIQLGDARFNDVPALIYDCAALSAHLGVKIDGVLGFPLFRETLLTLDYPHARVVLQPRRAAALIPGSTLTFDDSRKTPVISVRLGERTIVALIDSGSDAPLSLNPVGLSPSFTVAPRAGATVGTLTGDRVQKIARLADSLVIGDYTLTTPVVDLTDTLSAIGGEVLKNFTVTFDQERDRVTFFRESRAPISSAPQRSAGVSFGKTPAYWRIAGVVPGSPAAAQGVQPGDLVTRIDGEPIAKWDLRRYEQLVATAREISFTFLNGVRESEKRVAVFELVP